MKLDNERARGNIGDDTEIVNSGEHVGYAEATLGGIVVMFNRGREGGGILHPKPERVTVKGPFMDDEEHSEMEVTVGVWQQITDTIDTWDYIEAAENEVFSP